MRPALNPLVLSLKESATLAINLKALELRRQGADIVHFGFGQSPFPVPETIQQALSENSDKKDYLPTQGLPELCEAVAAFYQNEFGYAFAPADVCVGPGSKELIFQIIYLMEGPFLVPNRDVLYLLIYLQGKFEGNGITSKVPVKSWGVKIPRTAMDSTHQALPSGSCTAHYPPLS